VLGIVTFCDITVCGFGSDSVRIVHFEGTGVGAVSRRPRRARRLAREPLPDAPSCVPVAERSQEVVRALVPRRVLVVMSCVYCGVYALMMEGKGYTRQGC
jgi:hypothetical protein